MNHTNAVSKFMCFRHWNEVARDPVSIKNWSERLMGSMELFCEAWMIVDATDDTQLGRLIA